MNPPAGLFTGDGNAEIIHQLRSWWNTHLKGRATDSNTGFYLPDGSVLSPDAAYVSPKALKGLTKAELAGFPHLCPDFVIELLSASDSLVKTQEKMDRWIENGAQLGWLIDPYAKNAYIYAPGVPVTIVAAASIQGSGVVEGFALDLLAIWRRYEM